MLSLLSLQCYINKLTNKNINYKSIHKHVPINKNNDFNIILTDNITIISLYNKIR